MINEITESTIQKAIIQSLSYMENLGKLVYVRNNSFSGKISRPNGSTGYIKNSKRGSSDILIFTKNGKTLHMEIKTKRGKLSEEQKEFRKKVERLGHTYEVVKSFEDYLSFIRLYI